MAGGIGFTMLPFIVNLAFNDASFLVIAKVGILSASLVSGAAGWALFRSTRACGRAVPNKG